MKRINARTALGLVAVIGLTLAAGCSETRSSGDDFAITNAGGAAGTATVAVALHVAAGVTINKVSYVITGPSAFTKAGDIATDSSTTVSALFTLPVGLGYSITLTATSVDGTRQCAGQAAFDVAAGVTRQVNVGFQCAAKPRTGNVLVNGVLNLCPTIDSVIVNPAEVVVGGNVVLAATASDLDGVPAPLSYAWTASSGTLINATAPGATFTCTAAGTATVTLTVSDGDCGQTAPFQITCNPAGAGMLAALSSRAWGGTRNDEGIALATDAASDTFVGGFANGPVDLGCGPTAAAGASDSMLVAKLGPTGGCLWSKLYGSGTAAFHATGLGTDAAGDVFVIGTSGGTLDFGCGPMVAGGPSDVVMAELSPAGACMWSHDLGNANAQGNPKLTVDGAGSVYAVGTFAGTVNFGGAVFASVGGNDIFLVKLSGAGNLVWATRFGDAANQSGLGIGHDAANNIVISGSFGGTVSFGGTPLTSAGLGDAFVAKYASNAAFLWSVRFGDASDQSARGVAVDPTGNAVVIGDFQGSIDLGGGPLASLGGTDAWLAKLDPNGAPLWSRTFGGANNQTGVDVAVDRAGFVSFVSALSGSAIYGGGPTLSSAGGSDIVVGRLDPAGIYMWSDRFGDAATQSPAAVTVDGAGNTIATGFLASPTDFGNGPVSSGGAEDAFIVRLAP